MRPISARFSFLGAIVALAAIVAGCSSSTNPSPGPCGGVSGPVTLVYPAPNSTGIPANLQGVVFGVQVPLTSLYQAVIVPNGGSTQFIFNTVQAAPSPLPSPYATPSFANPTYQISPFLGQTLPAASLVNVYLNDLNSGCTPSYKGSFTTQ